MARCYLCPIGGEEADRLYFDTEPNVYEDRLPERRCSRHVTESGVVTQDMGVFDADRTLRAQSDWNTATTFAAWESAFRLTGQVWQWVDSRENEYRVFFRELDHERIKGHDAYRITVLYDVVEAL